MPVSGNDILAYSGNAGLGSNSDVPAIATKDLEIVNNTLDRLQTQNAVRNQNIFAQKIRDRDKLLAEIDSGQIKYGDLLEEDMPIVKEGLQKLDDAYFDRIKKGVNDIDAARKYNKAKRAAQDAVTQAQARKFYFDQTTGELAKEKLPRKQEAMKAHLDSNIKGGFWKDLTPYQQAQDLDIAGSILSTAANATEQFTDPKNPLIKGKRTVFDFDKTLLSNKDNFLNDVNKRHDQGQLLTAVQSLPPAEFLETMEALNNRIKEYNALKNVTSNQPGYVKEIAFTINPQNGKPVINEPLPDFAAKYTLAHQKPFGSVETELDKGALEIIKAQETQRHNKAQEAIGRTNAGANATRARTYAALQNKKLSQLNDQEKRVKNFWDGVTGKVKQYKVAGVDGDYVFAGDLPAGYQNVGGLDPDGKPIRLLPKKTPAGAEYYDTKFYDSNGGELDLMGQFDAYKKSGGKGSYTDLRSKLLREGKINMELIGENGIGNFETAYQTARAISNKGTTKGEEPVFGEQIVEQQEE